MTSPHSNSEQEEMDSPLDLPSSDSESEVEENEEGDVDSEVDEEEMKKWLSTAYERGSKKPMKKPLNEPWGLSISDTDVEKLKVGVKSRSMDDKWDILVEDPDEDGNISIHIIRSWLQEECYIFHIQSNGNGGSAKIESITWEGNKGGLQCGAEQAKKEAVMLSRGHLDCKFETLPQYPSSDFWASDAYKKVDEE